MKKISFPNVMIGTALSAGLLALVFGGLFRVSAVGWLQSCAITFFTVFYHFSMRLTVGALVPHRFSYNSPWFQPRAFEAPLYKTLRLKRWKDRMPTYDPRKFSLEENSLEQVITNMCQAEVVHEIIALCSLIPLLFSLFWDSFWVFFITSILSAALDLCFVMLQRYNRPRLMRILQKQSKKGIYHV